MFRNFRSRYIAYGFALGCIFPLLAAIVELEVEFHRLKFSDLVLVHKTQPLIWIIDTAPLVLAVLAGIAGSRKDTLMARNRELEKINRINRSIFDNSYEAIMLVDAETAKIIDVNPRFYNALGYTREEVLKFNAKDLIPEDRKDEFADMHQRLSEDGIFIIPSTVRIRKDGSRFPTEVVVVPMQLNGEKRLMIFNRDITAQEELKASERQLRHLIDNLGDLACLVKPDGEYVQVSPSSVQIVGYRPEELIGTNGFEYLHPDEKMNMDLAQESSKMLNKGKWMSEMLFRHKQGHFVWLEVVAEPIFDHSGNLVYITTTSRDVTARKKAEEDRDNLLQELEFRVQQRTAELTTANEILHERNIEIEDSISYAERLQSALLPPLSIIEENFADTFLCFLPRDKVSGDFYWWKKVDGQLIFIVADCTGHGVPGAFMSALCISILNRLTNDLETVNPHSILNNLDLSLHDTLSSNGNKEVMDGMDAAVCVFDLEDRKLSFEGAARPLIIVSKGEVVQFKGNRYSIGGSLSSNVKSYGSSVVELTAGDMIYLFSDGFPDQFGGPADKKFMMGNFRKLLSEIGHLDCHNQHDELTKAFSNWKGDGFQVDDITVLGIRV